MQVTRFYVREPKSLDMFDGPFRTRHEAEYCAEDYRDAYGHDPVITCEPLEIERSSMIRENRVSV